MSELTVINNWYPNRRANLPLGGTTYVSKQGSDATGQRGNVGRPYLTLTAAKNASLAGDTIVVWPGTYAENNLLKDQVNWYFMAGAIVSYVATSQVFSGVTRTGDNATLTQYGIFDDTPTGAVTCRIDGYGDFRFQNNGFGKCLGTIVTRNAGTTLNVKCLRVGFGYYTDSGFQGLAAIYVKNCKFVTVTCEEVYSVNAVGFQYDTGTLDSPGGAEVFWGGQGSGIYWEIGPCYFDVKVVRAMDLYCVGAAQPNANATDADMYIRSELLEGHCYTAGGVGATAQWKTWWYVGQMLEAPGFYTSGKHYVYIEKINCAVAQAVIVLDGATLWLTCQKITAALGTGNGSSWLQLNNTSAVPTVYADVQHLEDTGGNFGTNGAGIWNNGGVLHLKNAQAVLKAGNNFPMVLHSSGTTRLSNCFLDASANNNAAANPIKVAAAGCIIDKCVLKAAALADSVTAAAAQTVTSYFTKTNKAKNVNITVNVDALTADANVV